MNSFPRRNQMQQWVPAEWMIYDAVQQVESMGADVRLTDAVILLGRAQERVADFVDGVALSPSSPREPSEAVVEMMARRDYENDWPTPPHDTWEEIDEETRQDYRDDAREIIVKLRAIDFPPSGHET